MLHDARSAGEHACQENNTRHVKGMRRIMCQMWTKLLKWWLAWIGNDFLGDGNPAGSRKAKRKRTTCSSALLVATQHNHTRSMKMHTEKWGYENLGKMRCVISAENMRPFDRNCANLGRTHTTFGKDDFSWHYQWKVQVGMTCFAGCNEIEHVSWRFFNCFSTNLLVLRNIPRQAKQRINRVLIPSAWKRCYVL